jgi:hypothetical protein
MSCLSRDKKVIFSASSTDGELQTGLLRSLIPALFHDDQTLCGVSLQL